MGRVDFGGHKLDNGKFVPIIAFVTKVNGEERTVTFVADLEIGNIEELNQFSKVVYMILTGTQHNLRHSKDGLI